VETTVYFMADLEKKKVVAYRSDSKGYGLINLTKTPMRTYCNLYTVGNTITLNTDIEQEYQDMLRAHMEKQ